MQIDKDRWIRCGKCGHKLARLAGTGNSDKVIIELKCHSCKEINTWNASQNAQNAR